MSSLDQAIHDALMDHTSNHEWVDTVGPHVEAAVRAWVEAEVAPVMIASRKALELADVALRR